MLLMSVSDASARLVVISEDFLLFWSAGFADYSPLNRDMDLQSGIRPLPPEVGTGMGFFISGNNRSDDLFMFLTRLVTALKGIVPNRRYEVAFRNLLAADAHYRLNLDKGNQATGGPAGTVAGNISTGSSNCSDGAPFQTIERVHKHTFDVTSDAGGNLWLLIGTDSGFEGRTSLYYQSITATLTPVP